PATLTRRTTSPVTRTRRLKVDFPPDECLSLAVPIVLNFPARSRFCTEARRPSRAGLTVPNTRTRSPANGTAALSLSVTLSAFFLALGPLAGGPPLGGLEVGGEFWGGPF